MNARELLESARRRLDYWDIPEETVRAFEERGVAQKTVVLPLQMSLQSSERRNIAKPAASGAATAAAQLIRLIQPSLTATYEPTNPKISVPIVTVTARVIACAMTLLRGGSSR